MILSLSFIFVITACQKDDSVFLLNEVGIPIYLSDDEMIMDETYFDYVIIETYEALEAYQDTLSPTYEFSISGLLSDYDTDYFDDSFVVICYVVWEKYKTHVQIVNPEINENQLHLTVEYQSASFVIGDATNDLYAVFFEYLKDEATIDQVTVDYIEA